MSERTYLILGGVSCVGRNVVWQLLKENLAKQIIVIDKSKPELSWITGPHKQCFEDPRVVVKQKNLTAPANIEEALSTYKVDFVINCAAESRYGLSSEVYEEKITKLGVVCAKAVAGCPNVKRFIQISTGLVYSSSKEPTNENGKIKPWTEIARAFYTLEMELEKIPNLKYTVLRPAFCYGIGDIATITPRIVVTAVYQFLDEKMKLMWTKGLRMNTVHLVDVARACIFLCDHGTEKNIYNLADKSNTTQGSLTQLICDLFQVTHGFLNEVESNIAAWNLGSVCETINEKHMGPWSDICAKESISYTPLSPYIDKELLSNNHLSIDSSLIESCGFQLTYPEITKELLKEVLDDLVEHKLFPKNCSK